MSVIPLLASSLGRRDEVPNQELAKQIASKKDRIAVKELVAHLSVKDKNIPGDCIKVLYEIGAIEPKLIAGHTNAFINLLDSKNNRMQWGAMTALGSIAEEDPKTIYTSLEKIMEVADKGSVITKDHAVNILIALCKVKAYADDCFALLNEALLKSATNQFPMYAEKSMVIVNEKNKKTFIKTLQTRLKELETDSKKKRVEKLIKKLSA